MKLFISRAACSISPHIALEETGAPFEVQSLDIMAGETRSEDFLRINPKGKVPTLVLDDGTVITENPVILQYIARTFPDAGLLPSGTTAEYEALSICDYLTGTVQGAGIARLFAPRFFSSHEEDAEGIRQAGAAIIEKGFALLAPRLEKATYLLGDFSIADASLFYFELHATRFGLNIPDAVQRHFKAMADRPSVQKVMEREGLKVEEFTSGTFSF